MATLVTIAGSDSSARAGIQADLRTFAALGFHGLCAVTAVTAQGPQGPVIWEPVPTELVRAQLRAVFATQPPAAIKIGMLASAAIVHTVAEELARLGARGPVVCDPVLAASAGGELLDAEGRRALREVLLPQVSLLTPNVAEAEWLSGRTIRTPEDAEEAAGAILSLGPRAVLVTGGHLPEKAGLDVLRTRQGAQRFHGEWIPARDTHGTGCVFSSAAAARLAAGDSLERAVAFAQRFTRDAIRRAEGLHDPGGART